MILCVTPNPAIDRTLLVPGFKARGVFRTSNYVIAPGGKGLNVARAVQVLGVQPVCAGFLGGHTGRHVAEMSEAEGFIGRWTQIDNETRNCIIIANPDIGHTSVVNEHGPEVTHKDWENLQRDILAAASDIKHICFSGSLAPGSPLDAFSGLLARLCDEGKQVWVDTSGDALRTALTVPGINIKINDHEAEAILGYRVESTDQVARASHDLKAYGMNIVAITRGSQGAVMIGTTGTWYAMPPELQIVSAVGSGDSFLAGLVTGLLEYDEREALKRGIAAGSANALSAGGGSWAMADFYRILELIQIQEL